MVSGRLPGAVIGQVFRAGTSTPRDFPRYAGIIAKGLDIKLFRDAALVRCAVEGETLPFSGVTYIAPLANPAVPDKARSRLYTSDGRTVAATRWNFTQSVPGSNVYDQISIDPAIFSTTLTYLVDYVSTDRSLRDAVPVDELREVLAVGDNQGQIRYREGRDYRFTTTATGPLPGTGNLNPSSRVLSPTPGSQLARVSVAAPDTFTVTSPADVDIGTDTLTTSGDVPNLLRVRLTTTGTLPAPLAVDTDYWAINMSPTSVRLATSLENATVGTFIDLTTAGAGVHTITSFASVAMSTSAAYTHSYNRNYVLTCAAVGPSAPLGLSATQAKFVVECFPTSSGSAVLPGMSIAQANALTLVVDSADPTTLTQAVEMGIVLDFTGFNVDNFSANDKFAFSGYGPGMMELDDKLLNTNQFAEVSAVESVVETGTGDITTNPQSNFAGTSNQTYFLQCTAVANTGLPNRQATFVWRGNPKIKAVSGTVTATQGSAAIVGAGTSFMTEISAGDYIIVGNNPAPVKVAAVTDATNLILVGNFPFATVTSKALRIRETTGTLTVVANGSPNRVLMDQGVLLDFSFGSSVAQNFAVGDTYKLTAKVARNDYNGKENRNYDLTVTSIATPHAITATFSGNTAASTFGSQVFNEGTPLILPNNAVVWARNLTANPSRFNATPTGVPALPDVFELSLTFDGLLDWTLETEVTETIGSQDILRDLTGSVTGTVGAYFVVLRKIPTSVVYVSGPAPTFNTIAFNQVSGTTIVYFTTNPGAISVKYRHAGIEPSPGAAYFMSGYSKRPDADYDSPQLFLTRDAAREFLAPMTVVNDAAIANECAWDQDQATLPGVVVCLVKDSDSDGVFTTADYDNAIRVSEQFKGTTDFVVVNQFAAREEFRDSVVNMNDPTVARRRIGYFGFPVSYPIGDEFTSDSRVFTARRELQVFEETVARGTLAIIGNSYGKKTVLVDSLGDGAVDSIPTQVTLDGSFLAVALAARVASFNEPWESIYNLPISGFDEIEPLTETQMITLQDAGIICCRVEGGSAFYIGTMTTDSTEPSTQQLSGTVQRQYVLSRLQDVINRRVIGFVADSPEAAAQKLQGELVAELGSMVSERKIGKYVDETTGLSRALNPKTDVVAFRDRRDPTRAYFRTSWYQKYPLLYVDGVVAVDAPTP